MPEAQLRRVYNRALVRYHLEHSSLPASCYYTTTPEAVTFIKIKCFLWLIILEGPVQDWEELFLWASGGGARWQRQRAHGREKYLPQGAGNGKRLSKIPLEDKTPPTRFHFLMVPLPLNCATLEQRHALTTDLWVSHFQSSAIFPRFGKAI